MRVLRISHSAVVDAWRERERILRRRGVAITTVAAKRWNEAGADVALSPRDGEDAVGVATLGRHPALFVYDPRPLWRLLGQEWSVLEIHEEPFALATFEVLLLRALRRQKAPYSLYSAQNIEKRYPIPFRWLERRALRGASGLSVCNREAGRICEAKGFPGAASYIPLGVDTDAFTPGEPADADPRGLITVGYAGRLEPHKGVHVLLDAVAREPRLRLRLVGAGPQEAELRQQAARLGVADRVEFLGSLPSEQLPGFYRSCDVLAVPSLPTPGWLEQFGRVAVEAMACGTPVVASDTGALPDVVGDAGVLVPPGDAAALADALVRVGGDPVLAAELGRRGRVRAERCDWRAVADDYEELYRTMLHEPLGDPATRGVEVVVVAYRSPEMLRRALAPVASLPVTVVDNSSMPEIAAVCRELGVRYIDSGRNGGFGFGVNTALRDRRVPGADVLLLNPDAEVTLADVGRLHAALLAQPDLASVGPAQVDGTGEQTQVLWPMPSPLNTWLEAVGLARLQGGPRFVIGSVMLLRAEALRQVGGFDERFFLYAEETDWARRASLLGWRHAVADDVVALHVGAGTSTDSTKRDSHFHASQERYLRKHFGPVGWQVGRAGQVVGATLRGIVLPGERGRGARARARTFRVGPIAAEAAHAEARP